MVGTRIGRYEILGVLGEGAMGMVYKGHDTIIDRIVAIKTIKIGVRGKANDAIERFYHEARIAGRLAHPNIALIYDVGEEKGIHYLVLEYVEGVTLKDVIIENRELHPLDKIRILVLTARTLHHAHQRGVIHRDIKPANIMLLSDLQIKIMDFGIAMFATQAGNASEGLIGTPSYMSPEQINGGEMDRQTDVFSLGSLAYEFVTGKKPFIAESIPAMMDKILTVNPIPPHIVNPQVSEYISRFILKALEKDKQVRYQSVNDFADALEVYLNQMEMERTQDVVAVHGYDKTKLIESLKQKYTFFSDFTFEELLKIFNISSKKAYKKGDIIFKEGTLGTKLYVIISGKVKVTKVFPESKEATFLAELKAGECFGEMAIMDNSPRFATVIAETDCAMIAISEVILRVSEPQLCLKLYKNLAAVLSEKLKKSDTKINELWTKIKQLTSQN
ncbi:MAG: serine/threonine-protein kinase [Candidatus Magnetobacterium sp. LHC-1]|uniref:Protein kinase n=1 Tax=Candidatus Magnetobacterium casense TaxID=1455061 RepID=A0ABS6S1H2_9BACT|nr:serine/threonine-protein kinase [Candidatus Magnetobacterium casensis]MBF0606102.1 protein kinase [Nitrospirota bacterium]MBV6342666.1 protein kinase [Candidatus Magnetobacterium casensis]